MLDDVQQRSHSQSASCRMTPASSLGSASTYPIPLSLTLDVGFPLKLRRVLSINTERSQEISSHISTPELCGTQDDRLKRSLDVWLHSLCSCHARRSFHGLFRPEASFGR